MDGIPRRIPKLAVRNRASPVEDVDARAATPVSDSGSRSGSSGPSSSRSSQRIVTPRNLSEEALDQTRWSAIQDFGSEAPKSSGTGQTAKKKKGKVFGFFTLKEPSAAAWAELAEVEKQKMKQKGLSAAQVGAPGTSSSRKLPDYVPKVNSKWDGLPEGVKRTSEESNALNRTNRESMLSTASRQSNWAAISSMSTTSHSTTRPFAPWSLESQPGRDSSSSGSTRQAPALALIPDADAVEVTDDNKPQTFLRPPSPTHEDQNVLSYPTTLLSPPELEGDDFLQLQELDARSPSPAVNSPRTPPADGSDSRPALMGIHYPELDSPEQRPGITRSETSWYDDTNKEVVAAEPASPEPSRRPINFSRPRARKPEPPTLQIQTEPKFDSTGAQLTEADGVLLSPTLKGSSGRIDPFLTDTFASHSRETGHIPQRVASTLVKDTDLTTVVPPVEGTSRNPEETPISPLESSDQETHLPTSWDYAEPERPTTPTSAVYNPEHSHIRSRSETSLAPSVTPSELSERWQMSPKERLGLGANMRRSDVLPWETAENILDGVDVAKEDRSRGLAVPEGRSKRMSWRLSQKK